MSIARSVAFSFLALLLTACGGSSSFVGTYELDKTAMMASMKANMPKDKDVPSAEMDKLLEGMVASMKGTLEIKADKTVHFAMPMMGNTKETGTWRSDGEAIVVTNDDKKELRCTLVGGKLVCKEVGSKEAFEMVFQRK